MTPNSMICDGSINPDGQHEFYDDCDEKHETQFYHSLYLDQKIMIFHGKPTVIFGIQISSWGQNMGSIMVHPSCIN